MLAAAEVAPWWATLIGQIVIAVIGCIGLVLGARAASNAKGAREHAEAVNHAVNNRPSHEPPLYDRVVLLDSKIDGVAQMARAALDVADRVDGRVTNLASAMDRHFTEADQARAALTRQGLDLGANPEEPP